MLKQPICTLLSTVVCIEQPEGLEVNSDLDEKLVCKLKSLYGLKQSGCNWNRMLHDHLSENGFVQNPADHGVHTKQSENEPMVVIFWVDELTSKDSLIT